MSCTKPNHLYKKYWCKKCENFHAQNDLEYYEHEPFKINRYYCKQCKHTHVASLSFGKLFESHLQFKGHEFEFFGKTCAYKTYEFSQHGVCISQDDAKIIERYYDQIKALGWTETEERRKIRRKIYRIFHKKYGIIKKDYRRCSSCGGFFEFEYNLNRFLCKECIPLTIIFYQTNKPNIKGTKI